MFHKLLLATEHPCVHVIIAVPVYRALLLTFFWLLFVALSTLQCGRQDVKKYSLKEHNSVIDTRAKKTQAVI